MVRAAALAALFLLVACDKGDSEYDRRQRFIVMLADSAPTHDLCVASRDNAKAALYSERREDHRFWVKAEKNVCPPEAQDN